VGRSSGPKWVSFPCSAVPGYPQAGGRTDGQEGAGSTPEHGCSAVQCSAVELMESGDAWPTVLNVQIKTIPSECAEHCLGFQDHGMAWVGKDLKAHPVHLPWAVPPSSSGCPGPHPTWPWVPPGMGHPQLLWAAVPEPYHLWNKQCFS